MVAELHESLALPRALLEKIVVGPPAARLAQHDDSRAPEEEVALLLSAAKLFFPRLGLDDPADTERPDFDIGQLAEVPGVQDRDLALICREDLAFVPEGGRIHG